MITKTTQTIFLVILLLSLTSAITICEEDCYAGETYIINATESYDSWSFAGNKNNMTEEDLTIVQNPDYTINVTLNKYMKSDSFEIIFFNNIVISSDGGGGSGGGSSSGGTIWKTKYVERNVTTYLDKEIIKEVPGETITTEKIVKKIPIISWIILAFLMGIILFLFFTKPNTDERGYENNEQKNSYASDDFPRP